MLEICYLHDQVDVLFAQIQGSARVRLEDGTILRVNYDSHNGWPYVPVGRALVDAKFMTKDQVSMQSIRDWMEANPDQAKDIRRMNKSYVFFRITDLSTEDEAVGGEGVQLVPGRSIAIDRALHAYGTPFFITANLPIANEKPVTKFDRLVVAQDTGSAIVGPARADIYFGAGDEAARIAGRIKNPGDFVMLLPRELDPVEAGHDTPLPPERPSSFTFNVGTMEDPTAVDPAGDDATETTAPEARNGAESESKTPAEKMSRRRSLSDEEEAMWSGYARSITPLPAAKSKAKTKTDSKSEPAAPQRSAKATPRSAAPHSPLPPVKPPRAGAVRPALEAAFGARPRRHRCADRFAWHDANRSASGARVLSAASAVGRRQDRAGRHRQGRRQLWAR